MRTIASPFDQLSSAVRWLLIANVVAFFGLRIFPGVPVELFGLIPADVFRHYRVWQLVTYAFIHGSGMHLFFNMFALWMVGPAIEGVWGTSRFLKFYFACAIGAALTQSAIAPNVMVIGASGAIYGLLAAFAVLFPDAVMLLFFVFPARAPHAVFFIGLMALLFSFSSPGSRVAYLAHLGGLATGYLWLKAPGWAETFRMWRIRYRFEHPKGRRAPRSEAHDLSREVDRILEKISSRGVDSLTAEEHQTMQRYAAKKH